MALEEGILVPPYPKIEWAASPSAGTGVFRAAGADSRLNKKIIFWKLEEGRITWKREPEWRKRKKVTSEDYLNKYITIGQVLSFANTKISPDSLVLRLNVSLQCTMVSKLFVTHVTVICCALVLCKFMPPQVSLVCERWRALVAFPFFLEQRYVKSWNLKNCN